MKEFNDQLMKFKITDDKLKMEISLKDLVWLFHSSPENIADDGESSFAKIKRGKRQEFAEYFVKILMKDAPYERNCFRRGGPFEDAFKEITVSGVDFCKYSDRRMNDMKELNGFVEEFYILGNLGETYYIDEEGEPSITNPSQAKRFNSYSEASDYFKQNKDNYYDNLYPREVRITAQLL